MGNPRFVCIALRKTDAAIAAVAGMQIALAEAGFIVTTAQEAAAKQALLDRHYDVLIVVDEIQPDENGDAFLPWVNALPNKPVIFFAPTIKINEPRGQLYDLASKGYSMDAYFGSMPEPNQLLHFVRRLVANLDRMEAKTDYENGTK